MTVQLIEIYFRTLKYARAGNTCCSVEAIFHLSKIDSKRAGHTYANDKNLAITRNRCYVMNCSTNDVCEKREINIYIEYI